MIDALIDVLAVTDICMAKITYPTICSVQYCFSLCWKLLLGLPPSTPHVEALMQDKVPNLHSLMWSVRCLHPVNNSHSLIVNSLVKQVKTLARYCSKYQIYLFCVYFLYSFRECTHNPPNNYGRKSRSTYPITNTVSNKQFWVWTHSSKLSK